MGLLIKAYAPASFWSSIGKTAADFPALTLRNFLVGNLLPVTIGNLIGGTVMVAAVYWFVYLRKRPKA
jgi:formate transporter